MAANTRLATATQILCALAHLGEKATSQSIANGLHTNPVLVLRLLKSLEHAGLVTLRPGRDGGVAFARPPGHITLQNVHNAVDPAEPFFALRPGGNPRCPINRAMPGKLGPVFAAATQAAEDVLKRTTIANLMPAPR